MTADCLPLVFAAEDGSEVAVIHAGWRGLCDGILAAAVAALPSSNQQLKVWMGPAIGPKAFEVGEDVRHAFISTMGQAAAHHFIDKTPEEPPGSHGDESVVAKKYFADLYGLARLQLRTLGVEQISGGGHCTYSEEDKFFSYRRSGVTGRMATVAMLRPAH
jgi:YfiH family protein